MPQLLHRCAVPLFMMLRNIQIWRDGYGNGNDGSTGVTGI